MNRIEATAIAFLYLFTSPCSSSYASYELEYNMHGATVI